MRTTGRHLPPPFLPPQALPLLTAKLICPRHKHISICSTSVFLCIITLPSRVFKSHQYMLTRKESAVLNIFVVLDTHSARILACIIFTIISFSPDIPSMLSDKSDLWSRKMSNNWLNSTPLYFTPTTSETSESADRYSEVLDITWRGTSRSWENFLRRKVSYIEDHV